MLSEIQTTMQNLKLHLQQLAEKVDHSLLLDVVEDFVDLHQLLKSVEICHCHDNVIEADFESMDECGNDTVEDFACGDCSTCPGGLNCGGHPGGK